MNSKEFPVPTLILKENCKILSKISLVLVFFLGACSPAVASPAPVAIQNPPVDVQNVPTEVLPTPTLEASPTATSIPEEEPIYPYYLTLATKLDIPSRTLNSVTTKIDWVYADESRIAIHYTISGLDWPDGSSLDPMQQVQMSSTALANAQFGGFNGGSGANSSYAEHGVITGDSDQFLVAGALNGEKTPSINLNVAIPVEGPTKVGTFHFNFNVPVANGIRLENMEQTVLANNVSITLKSLILTPSHAQAVICFQMPSAIDWGLSASRISVSGREYPFTSGGILTGPGAPDAAITAPERCNEVGFDIGFDDKTDTSLTLTIPKLIASVNEVVTEETVAKANKRLAEKGIEFNYINIDHGGNFEILKRPEGLSDEEIGTLIWDALAEQYEGPWVFTVEIPR
jgi:hypothetical protein